MTRINDVFGALQARGGKALIPYITAGDPHPQHTVGLMHALVAGGADIIELGVPFSDPMADGPTIQLACERALMHNTSLWNCVEMVAEFRRTNTTTPVVLMGYLNPIEARGLDAFAAYAKQAGVDGVLIVDVPVGATIANMEHSVRRMALGTAVVGLVLIGGISLAFRRFLLRRLYRFERAALAIAGGDLNQRVPVDGNDALTRLEALGYSAADAQIVLNNPGPTPPAT